MKKLILKAPAKVNYRLDVLNKRPDGYHELRMVMQRIDLCDEISITLCESAGITVSCDREDVPGGPKNIAWKAAEAMLASCGSQVGVDIFIRKNIPMAAGLGGGSSDAATVLMGLNELLGLKFSDEKLMEIGVKLGADVPFFVFKKTALAEGIGEKLTPVEGLPPVWLVLVNPNIHVSTAWVYQNLRLTNRKDGFTLPQFYNRVDDICALLSNDLESVTADRFPVIGEIKRKLLAGGARGVLMSGSGPTVFAVFDTEENAQCCYVEVRKIDGWASFLTRTL